MGSQNSFLNGELEENEVIYSPIFDGYELFGIYKEFRSKDDCDLLERKIAEGKSSTLYLKMKKSAYGTKQTSRNWFIMLNKWMYEHGYVSVNGDPSLYVKRDGDPFTIVAIYVDDCVGTSTNEDEVKDLFDELNKTFKVN